jgi:hypothetical protein
MDANTQELSVRPNDCLLAESFPVSHRGSEPGTWFKSLSYSGDALCWVPTSGATPSSMSYMLWSMWRSFGRGEGTLFELSN